MNEEYKNLTEIIDDTTKKINQDIPSRQWLGMMLSDSDWDLVKPILIKKWESDINEAKSKLKELL